MAKINARGTHQVGTTLYTEALNPRNNRVYYEAFRLRSDGALLTRIISTRPAEGNVDPNEQHETKHSSGFRVMGEIPERAMSEGRGHEFLRKWLIRHRYTIVKEA